MAKEKDIIIANHHTGPIMLPRMYMPNVSGDPSAMKLRLDSKTIQPGHTVILTATEWEARKAVQSIKYYLDHGLLAEVKRDKEVDVNVGATTDLVIPEHLQADQDGAVTVASAADPSANIKATIIKQTKGTTTVV